MKRCRTLEEVVEYILNRHKKIRDRSQEGGVRASLMWRKSDGKRQVFSEMNNFRIFDWDVLPNNSLSIQTIATGFAFRGNKEIQQTARTILSDLAVVNVYDWAAEFFSENSVDFAYTMNSEDANFQHLHEWTKGVPGELRATWINENNDTEAILNNLSGGRKVFVIDQNSRQVDMDFELDI